MDGNRNKMSSMFQFIVLLLSVGGKAELTVLAFSNDSWFWRATVFKWEQFLGIVLIIISNNKQQIDVYILNWCFLLFYIHWATQEQGFQDTKEIDLRQIYGHLTT